MQVESSHELSGFCHDSSNVFMRLSEARSLVQFQYSRLFKQLQFLTRLFQEPATIPAEEAQVFNCFDRKSSTVNLQKIWRLQYIAGIAGVTFVWIGTSMRGRDRIMPLVFSCTLLVVCTIHSFQNFFASFADRCLIGMFEGLEGSYCEVMITAHRKKCILFPGPRHPSATGGSWRRGVAKRC